MDTTRRGFLRGGLAGLACLMAGSAVGQVQTRNLLEAGQRFLEDNLDPAVLNALRSGDVSQVDKVLNEVLAGLQNNDVLDLAALQDAVNLAVPLLQRSPQTKPYASWLKSRMDYFRVAEQLRSTAPAPPTPQPGRPAPPPSNPTPTQERKAWQQQVAQQPAPKGAAGWVQKLKPVFRNAGAPPELAWLGEIESSFDPHARSPAGAAGMFQLMPGTAKSLGLKLQPTDERLDPEKSARAAGTYLRKLHSQFNDWQLVLAGYNAGPGRVSELLKQRRARSFDAIAPSLPAETQMYVPKFEAVLKRREGEALQSLKIPAPATPKPKSGG